MVENFNAEQRLILLCASVQVDPERIDSIKQLGKHPLNWDYVLKTAALHRVLPLIYWNLDKLAPEIVPEPIMATMRDYFQENTRLSLFLKAELRNVLAWFDSSHLPAILYKGLALGALAYHDLPLRVTTDLDIVVHERDADRAGNTLIEHGYSRLIDEDHQAPTTGYRRYFYHDTFRNTANGAVVELHWRFMRDPYILAMRDEYFWGRVQRLDITGLATASFRPEDLLLLLCVHGGKHYWPELVLVTDVSELVRSHPDMNWDDVVRQAKVSKAQRFLWVGLLLANQLLGADLPEKVLAKARADRIAVQISEDIAASFFIDKHDRGISAVGWIVRDLSLRQRWQDKAVFIFQHMVDWDSIERDMNVLRLPKSLLFVYYVIRPFRLLWSYSFGLIKEAIRRQAR